jgi:hypothetical protein
MAGGQATGERFVTAKPLPHIPSQFPDAELGARPHRAGTVGNAELSGSASVTTASRGRITPTERSERPACPHAPVLIRVPNSCRS